MLDFGQQVFNDPQGGSIWQALQGYQRDLNAYDRSSLQALVRTYKGVLPDFQSTIAELDQRISSAAAKGLQPSASWVFQQDRYRQLEQQVHSVTGRLSIVAGGEADKQALQAMRAQDKFFASLSAGQASFGDTGDLRTWATLPSRTMESFIGLSKGSPLMAKFEADAGKDAMRAVRTTLAGHIATGRPARQTAKLMADRVGGVTLTRAMTITRTEAARARRAAALATFQVNPMLRGWVWRSALDDRTCAACIALHGREFQLTEPQRGHPNCRCVMIPMRNRGINPDVGTGSDFLFRELGSGGPQRLEQILGKGKAQWWKDELNRISASTGMPTRLAGQQALERMQTLTPNTGYGGMYRPVPLWQLRGGPRPGTRLPEPSAVAPPTGGFNARPDYESTVRAETAFLGQGADPTDWSAASANKAAAQQAVYEKVQGDPAMREWALKEYNRRNFTTFGNLDDVNYEALLRQEIRSMVDTWAGTSGDSSGRAVALQVAAQRQFGLDAASLTHFGKTEWGVYGTYSNYDDWYKAVVQPNLDRYEFFDRKILQAQYDVTQGWFRQQGITHVTLFRSAGQGTELGSVYDKVERASETGQGVSFLGNLQLQPLSSFTTRPSVTGGFGNVFYQTTVPVEFIHSTARTGLGCLGEYEWVVMAAHDAPATLTSLYRVQQNYAFWGWIPGGTQGSGLLWDSSMPLWESTVPLP